jgi:hypothetical protein
MRTRILAAFAAVTGVLGLAIQLVLLVGRMGPLPGAWRYFGYYTILTNVGAAAVAAAVAFGGKRALAGPRPRLMAATSMLMVGVVYSAALRGLWNPVGAQKVADIILHDVAPSLWLLFWILSAGSRLRWGDLWWALIPPGLYLIYALARGAIDGWYAYWFLDPSRGSGAEIAMSIVILLSSFAFVATVLVTIDRAKEPRRSPRKPMVGPVDAAWTLGEEPNSRSPNRKGT